MKQLVYIPNYHLNEKYFNKYFHHSKQFEEFEETKLKKQKIKYFHPKWRKLSKEDLIFQVKRLFHMVQKHPQGEGWWILHGLLQSSYLKSYLEAEGVTKLILYGLDTNDKVITKDFHGLKRKVMKELNDDELQKVYACLAVFEDKLLGPFQCSDPCVEAVLKLFFIHCDEKKHVNTILLQSRAYSALRSMLKYEDLMKRMKNENRKMRYWLESDNQSQILAANNYLHCILSHYRTEKYLREEIEEYLKQYNLHHPLVKIIYENISMKDTIMAFDNLAILSNTAFDKVILAGGFRLCFDFVDHENELLRRLSVMLLKHLCTNSSDEYLVYPFRMCLIFDLAPFLDIKNNDIETLTYAFQTVSHMLSISAFNSQSTSEKFNTATCQPCSQAVLSFPFDDYTEQVDTLMGAASLLYKLSIENSRERATNGLNSGILKRVCQLYPQAISTETKISLLSLVACFCKNSLSVDLALRGDNSLANDLVEMAGASLHSKDDRFKNISRKTLSILADVLKVDKVKLFEKYQPSNPTYRYLSLPDCIVERSHYIEGYIKSESGAHRLLRHQNEQRIKEARRDKSEEGTFLEIWTRNRPNYEKMHPKPEPIRLPYRFPKRPPTCSRLGKKKYDPITIPKDLLPKRPQSAIMKLNSLYEPEKKGIIETDWELLEKLYPTKKEKEKKIGEVNSADDIQKVVVSQKDNSFTHDVKHVQKLRVCSFCGNASFTVVYKKEVRFGAVNKEIFCSQKCRDYHSSIAA